LLFLCTCTLICNRPIRERYETGYSRDRDADSLFGGKAAYTGRCTYENKGIIMRKHILKLAVASIAAGTLSTALPAFAAEEEAASTEEAAGPIDITATATFVSDYRFRGVSLSGKDVAVQGGLTVAHESGVYVGVWASTLSENPGNDVEVDLFAGFSGGEAITYDIGATYYVYPGVSDFNYVETTGKLGTTVGPATLGVLVAYAPKQNNLGDNDNLYLATNASVGIPDTPFTLSGSFGYEDGAFGGPKGDKLDWSAGVSASFDMLTLGASYVDSNRRSVFAAGDAKKTIVLSVGLTF
jgi:uncharacterized protein (TIGR02001 family)